MKQLIKKYLKAGKIKPINPTLNPKSGSYFAALLHDKPLSGTDPIGKFAVTFAGVNPIVKAIGGYLGSKLITAGGSKVGNSLINKIGTAVARNPEAESKMVKMARPVLNTTVMAVPEELSIKGAATMLPATKGVSWGTQYFINR